MPSATGSSWEKYKKEFADDEVPEKKITPLSDECVGKIVCGAKLTMSGISKFSKPMVRLRMRPTLETLRNRSRRSSKV